MDAVSLTEDLFANVVEVLDSSWEPWHFRRAYLGDSFGDELQLFNCCFHVRIFVSAFNVDEEIHVAPVVCGEFGGFRLNSLEVDVVGGEDVKCFIQDSWSLHERELQTGLPHHLPELVAGLWANVDAVVSVAGRRRCLIGEAAKILVEYWKPESVDASGHL